MSDENEITTSPLHQAWLACRRSHDSDTANMVLTQHGGDGTGVNSVPKNRVDACIAALQKLAGKPKADAPSDGLRNLTDRLSQVRKEAFARIGSAEFEAAKPPKTLDPAAIYSRWNNPPENADT